MPELKPYNLTIFFRQNEFSISVFDDAKRLISSKKTEINLLHTTEDELVRIMAQEPEIQQDYKKIRIVCESAHYAFVPKEIFKPEDAEVFLGFQQKKLEGITIFNFIDDKNIVNVFSVPENLSHALSRFYEQPQIEHHLTYIANDFAQNMRAQHVFLWLRADFFDVLVFSDNRLQFVNTFKFGTKEDVLYFTMLVFTQLSLDAENTETTVLNADNQQDVIYLLKQYIKQM
jgi:hypothetical protein